MRYNPVAPVLTKLFSTVHKFLILECAYIFHQSLKIINISWLKMNTSRICKPTNYIKPLDLENIFSGNFLSI